MQAEKCMLICLEGREWEGRKEDRKEQRRKRRAGEAWL